MKLLTINTHSLLEEDYENKLKIFVDAVAAEKPDIIAMQEVNQLHVSDNVTVNADNHALRAANLLSDRGIKYSMQWLPMKIGYDKYDEGLSILSLSEITETDTFCISNSDDYKNWKTRKILGVKTAASGDWFYTVHLGWWNDEEEPFSVHWRRLTEHIKDKRNVFLMGDMNSRADVRGEGYDLITGSGWHDTYLDAQNRDSGVTVFGKIDGWSDETKGMRIDYIFASEKRAVKTSRVIFNGESYPIISDHCGVLVEI